MKLTNAGWAFAVSNGRSGVVPLNYIVIIKRNNSKLPQNYGVELPVPRLPQNTEEKSQEKRVTFGKNEIINIPSKDNNISDSKINENVEQKNNLDGENGQLL